MLTQLECASALIGAGLGYAKANDLLGVGLGALGGYATLKAADYIAHIEDIQLRRLIVKGVFSCSMNFLVYSFTQNESAALMAGAAALYLYNAVIEPPRPIVIAAAHINRQDGFGQNRF